MIVFFFLILLSYHEPFLFMECVMKKFGLLLFCSITLSFSSTAIANNQNQAKINVVKQAATQAIKCYKDNDNKLNCHSRNKSYTTSDPLYKFSDNSLKSAIRHAHKYKYLASDDYSDHPCDEWRFGSRLLFGVLAGGIDFGNPKISQFKFTNLSNGKVRVNYLGNTTDVSLTCSGNSCLISDISGYKTDSDIRVPSFKNRLSQCHLVPADSAYNSR